MISRPTKAFILAAGFGTRILPITRDLPKPMLPVWGIPALERVLRMVRRWGVTDVLINLHHLPNEILQHVLHREKDGLRIELSFESDILGTGGALPRAAWFLDKRPFWMINADVVSDLDPRPLLRAFKPGRTISVAWLHDSRGPRTVEMEKGFVTNWQSKRPKTPGTYTFCGVQLLSPAILRHLPASGMASIVTAYQKAMADGHRIAGVVVPRSYWADIGTPAQYLQAHRELHPAAEAAIDPSATIHASAIVKHAVVMAGATLGPRAVVENAIVGRNAVVNTRVPLLAMPAAMALDDMERAAVAATGAKLDLITALPLGPRGSARTFTRLVGQRRPAILVRYKPERLENTLYAGHARYLARAGVRVPAVLFDDPATCTTLLEDLGDESLQALVPTWSPARVKRTYERVLDSVVRFHERGVDGIARAKLTLVPAFRWTLYHWEHNYFAEHFLQDREQLDGATIDAIKADLHKVASKLVRAPRVLVHRDLQSSNILLHRGEPAFIDFQGMRYGPAAYDLASLLCDPYVNLPASLQEHLVAHYASLSRHGDRIHAEFWYAAIQRLGQALGAYAKLGSNPDTAQFAAYIDPALVMLRRAVDRVPGLPALRAWVTRGP